MSTPRDPDFDWRIRIRGMTEDEVAEVIEKLEARLLPPGVLREAARIVRREVHPEAGWGLDYLADALDRAAPPSSKRIADYEDTGALPAAHAALDAAPEPAPRRRPCFCPTRQDFYGKFYVQHDADCPAREPAAPRFTCTRARPGFCPGHASGEPECRDAFGDWPRS
jgi:hypothetical protein